MHRLTRTLLWGGAAGLILGSALYLRSGRRMRRAITRGPEDVRSVARRAARRILEIADMVASKIEEGKGFLSERGFAFGAETGRD